LYIKVNKFRDVLRKFVSQMNDVIVVAEYGDNDDSIDKVSNVAAVVLRVSCKPRDANTYPRVRPRSFGLHWSTVRAVVTYQVTSRDLVNCRAAMYTEKGVSSTVGNAGELCIWNHRPTHFTRKCNQHAQEKRLPDISWSKWAKSSDSPSFVALAFLNGVECRNSSSMIWPLCVEILWTSVQ